MTTDLTTTPSIVHPATGETLELTNLAGTDLAQLLDDASAMYDLLMDFKADVIAEVCRRADMTGQRTIELNGVKFEVNAPTEDHYEPEAVRIELGKLVAEGVIDQAMIDALIVQPTPKPPAERVDKRRLNAILKTDDRRVLGALALARTRAVNRRTVKVLARPTDTTAEEVS